MAIFINSFSSSSNLVIKYLVSNNFIRTKVNLKLLILHDVLNFENYNQFLKDAKKIPWKQAFVTFVGSERFRKPTNHLEFNISFDHKIEAYLTHFGSERQGGQNAHFFHDYSTGPWQSTSFDKIRYTIMINLVIYFDPLSTPQKTSIEMRKITKRRWNASSIDLHGKRREREC
jgi:hypothetical protein